MSLVYTWQFPTLDVVYDEDGMTDVVQTIHWVLMAQDGEYTASYYGTVGVGAPDPQSFIPYSQLTEAEVQAWTESAMGEEQVAEYKTGLAQQIEAQKAPKSGPLPPPWAA
jgi:hypothetical protein